MARSGKYIQQLQGYKAFIPTPLPPVPSLDLTDDLIKKNNEAMLLLSRLDSFGAVLPNPDLFISMYVKKEALLSTQIEGTQASLEDIFEFESGESIENINDVEEVVNYIRALNYGTNRLETLPMSNRLIKELHAILLKGTRGAEKTPGEFKRSQNWIGKGNASLHDAFFVPPPPEEAKIAMSDLEKYMHSESPLPELVNCALIHYQFETIHPFLDGNGRVGRLLITLYLFWKKVTEKPLLYISLYLKKNRQEYYDRLTMVRNSGNYEQWVNFFIQGVIETAESAISNTKRIMELKNNDTQQLLEKKASIQTIGLLNQLFYTPIVTVGDIQKQLTISYPTAASLIKQLQAAGILKEITGRKRSKKFVYTKYLDILSEGTMPFK